MTHYSCQRIKAKVLKDTKNFNLMLQLRLVKRNVLHKDIYISVCQMLYLFIYFCSILINKWIDIITIFLKLFQSILIK